MATFATVPFLYMQGVPAHAERGFVKSLSPGRMRVDSADDVFDNRAHLDSKGEGRGIELTKKIEITMNAKHGAQSVDTLLKGYIVAQHGALTVKFFAPHAIAWDGTQHSPRCASLRNGQS
jgi:hypothetical protein